ncbi:MAG: serpin family protein, partial [Candidatus Marinimicrobia bacterium]|nr:serpin family protein [Candidatus Neomarinimicrobiota bacterium]
MFNKLKFAFVLCIGFLILQCTKNPTKNDEPADKNIRELSIAEKELVESDNKFGLKLFKEINKQDQDKNIFISPLSVSMALGMTYNGADSTTLEAMHETLEYGNLSI